MSLAEAYHHNDVPPRVDCDRDQWGRVKDRLRADVGEDVFVCWFARIELESVDEAIARMSVATKFLKSWIESHYAEQLLACWQAERPTIRRIELSVRSGILKSNIKTPLTLATLRAAPPVQPTNGHASEDRSAASGSQPTDPRLTFASFIEARTNALALAAARQIGLAQPGDRLTFNPLYLHATTGLGKTHLLHAIVRALSPDRTALYLTAERFMYEFASAVRHQSGLDFKRSLRIVDLLVIDDLQFLHGKATQAEFSWTLNAMIDAGRQVVVAADRPPLDLEILDDRARSRLAGGLVVEIGPLTPDLRLEILKARVAAARQHHPGFDIPAPVLGYIADVLVHNARDLEGAVNRLLAHSKLTGAPVTRELAEREVRDLIRPIEPKRVRIEDIQRIVARHYNVSRGDMLSARRTANVVRPRQVAMYLAKTLTLRSLPEIGRRFGGRDHTTVLHGVRKIDRLVAQDSEVATEVNLLKKIIQEQA